MNIQQYIESGILETYVMGAASEQEARELLQYKAQYPEVAAALKELELDLEMFASQMAIVPPPHTWTKINDNINDLIITPEYAPVTLRPEKEQRRAAPDEKEKYLEVEYESSYMRVHKTWKWVFIAIFVLSKLFLIASVYFYLENRQAQQQIQELKAQLQHIQSK